jgi:alkylmercury lyase
MDIDQLAADLDRSFAASGSDSLFRPLLVLLARGEPVSEDDLTAATGLSSTEVHAMLAELPDLETDEQGRIVGSGLTLRATPHRFTIDGHQLYTWCALDTLIFPAVLGQAATVESPCHETGATIRLRVDPEAGVTSIEPPTAVMSIVTPAQQGSIRTAFCNQVHFFVTLTAAQPWLAEHPRMSVLPVTDAHRLGQTLIPALLKTPTTRSDYC